MKLTVHRCQKIFFASLHFCSEDVVCTVHVDNKHNIHGAFPLFYIVLLCSIIICCFDLYLYNTTCALFLSWQEETANAQTEQWMKLTLWKRSVCLILSSLSNIFSLWTEWPGLEDRLKLIPHHVASLSPQKSLQMSPSGKTFPSISLLVCCGSHIIYLVELDKFTE